MNAMLAQEWKKCAQCVAHCGAGIFDRPRVNPKLGRFNVGSLLEALRICICDTLMGNKGQRVLRMNRPNTFKKYNPSKKRSLPALSCRSLWASKWPVLSRELGAGSLGNLAQLRQKRCMVQAIALCKQIAHVVLVGCAAQWADLTLEHVTHTPTHPTQAYKETELFSVLVILPPPPPPPHTQRRRSTTATWSSDYPPKHSVQLCSM